MSLFVFQACFPESDTAKLESHIFRMYDKNGDGHIDFREFMIVLYVMSNGTPEENLKQVCKFFDKTLGLGTKALAHVFGR